MDELSTADILRVSDPANIRFSNFLAVANERLAPLGLKIVDVVSSSMIAGVSAGRPFDTEPTGFSRDPFVEFPPDTDWYAEADRVVVRISQNGLARVEAIDEARTVFVLSGADVVSDTLPTLLQRLYHHALVQESARIRTETVDAYLKVHSSNSFWREFLSIVSKAVPFDAAQIIASENLSATPHILYPTVLFGANSATQKSARDLDLTQSAAHALDELMKTRRAAHFKFSADPIVGPLTSKPSAKPATVIYCPLIAQGRKLQRGGELRVGGAIRIVDPLVRGRKAVRGLTWEDHFLWTFAAEVCAVLMNNYFVKNAEIAALQRISHGFSATLNAMISAAMETDAELAHVARYLLPYSTSDAVLVKHSLESATDRTRSLAAWSEEMWQQVLFEAKMYDVFSFDGEQEMADIRVITSFSKEVVGRVFRTVKSLREKYKSPWVNLPNHHDVLQRMPRVKGDPVLLRAVFRNLLENSVKYPRRSEPEIVIGLSYVQQGKFVRVRYADNGIGITNEERQHIFNGPYRSPRAARANEGKGLGLMQAKAFLEHMGGDISIDGTPPTQGAAFIVRIPVAS